MSTLNINVMKYITIDEAYQILERSKAVIWGEPNMLSYFYINNEEDDELFLHLEGEDEYTEYSSDFKKVDNLRIKVDGDSMYLIDVNKNETKVTPLFTANFGLNQLI